MNRRGVLCITLVLALGVATSASAAKKLAPKKRVTTTTKVQAKSSTPARLINTCSLLNLIPLDGLIPIDLRGPIAFSGQGGGGVVEEGAWKTVNLKEEAVLPSSTCYTLTVSGPVDAQLDVGITQQHRAIEQLLRSRPNFKRGTVDGITQPTWIDRHGAELTDAGQLRKTAGCAIVVATARGVFGAYWTPWRSLETDPGKISCTTAEELMRRELAALDAGGYTYLPAV